MGNTLRTLLLFGVGGDVLARKFVDLSQLMKAIKEMPKESQKEIKKAVKDSALMVERDAKINAPVDTGTLRNSISHRIIESDDTIVAEVGASVKYGKFQEYGTGQRGKSGGIPTPSDYEYGSSKGIPAQPFLGPALAKNKAAIQKKIERAIKDALKG